MVSVKSNLDEILKRVLEYRRKVESVGEELVYRLTEEGVSLAQMNAAYMDIYDSGELVNGMESQYSGGKGYIVSTATHSVFCEFGTGVVGANNPHPDVAVLGWSYDVNQHGELGWWYYNKDGERRWTKGMPARPYMYDTAKCCGIVWFLWPRRC